MAHSNVELGYADMVEALIAGSSQQKRLKQALEGDRIQTGARFVLDDESIVYWDREMMCAR